MKILNVLFIFTFSVFSTVALALKSDGKVHIEFNKKDFQYTLTVDNGFHFNIQAPCFLENNNEKLKPIEKTEKKLRFNQPKLLNNNSKISIYVCDDAKTVCEPQVFELNKVSEPLKDKKSTSSSESNKERSGNSISQFNLNGLSTAFSTAKKQNKLVLIDFTASWCPACIRLIHESFNTKEFISASKKYVLTKIDVDLVSNQELLKKYNIKAFPSLVITNSDGHELARILDYLPGHLLAKQLNEVADHSQLSISDIEKKALKGDSKSQIQLAKYNFNSLNFEKAITWFEKANLKNIEYYQCLVNMIDENSTQFPKVETLKKAIENNPEHYYSIDWRKQLAEELKEKNKENWKQPLDEAIAIAKKWLDEPQRSQSAFAKGELLELNDLLIPEAYNSLADIYELLGDKENEIKNAELAIQKTLNLNPTINTPTQIIYLVHYMKRTRPSSEITPWLVKLETAYPNEFTYFYRHASLLQDKNENQAALPQALKAYELSYGSNKLKSGLLLAKVQNSIKNKEGAVKTLHELLNSDLANVDSYQKSIAKIKKYYDEINQ